MCLAAAAACALLALAPPAEHLREVTVAAHDLAAGTTLGADDLTTRHAPPAVVPAHALEAAALRGAVLASGVRTGEFVTDVRVAGAGLAAAAGRGRVVVPLSIEDANALLPVRPGDLIDVIAATSGATVPDPSVQIPASSGSDGSRGASFVARGALVLAVPGPVGGGLLSAGSARRTSLMVSVTPAEALTLAQAATGARLSLVLTQRQDASRQ